MPAFTATAPAKIILFGEHAVVYGRPAIAVPVNQVQARAVVTPNPRGGAGDILIQAPEVGIDSRLGQLDPQHPLALAVSNVAMELGVIHMPAFTLRVTSTIPVAAGLGSGAAVSVAVIRAVAAFLGHPLPDKRVSALAYEVEKLHHGTPSGIDNTVVTYNLPVFFERDRTLEILRLGAPFTIVIGDTGIASPTAIAVGDVRRAWQSEVSVYERIFDDVQNIVLEARQAIENGAVRHLGPLMDANHQLLQRIGVSCAELDRLVVAARMAGAWGAKLSGGGRGGNMIALVSDECAFQVAQALKVNGATRTIRATIQRKG